MSKEIAKFKVWASGYRRSYRPAEIGIAILDVEQSYSESWARVAREDLCRYFESNK